MIRGAIKWQQLSHRLFLKRIPILPGIIHKWIHFRYNSDLAPITEIGEGTSLGHGGIAVVINPEAVVGKHCILAQNVTLAKHRGGAPVLEDCIYVGHGSIVMGGGKNW